MTIESRKRIKSKSTSKIKTRSAGLPLSSDPTLNLDPVLNPLRNHNPSLDLTLLKKISTERSGSNPVLMPRSITDRATRSPDRTPF
jgi:hypothetical protein